jgi:hypothetical protein
MLSLGCAGQKKPELIGRTIHAELEEFVLAFEKEYDTFVNYPVIISDGVSDQYDGVCTSSTSYYGGESFTQKNIFISKKTYEVFKDYKGYLKVLLYHELGHCSFSLQHDEEVIESGSMKDCPSSVMYPSVMWYCFVYYESYYIAELHDKIGL